MSTWQFTPYALLFLAAVIISFWLAYLGWRMQPVQGTKAFSMMAISTGLWSLGYLLGFFNTNLAWKLVMLRIEYLGIIGADYFWLLFACNYTNLKEWLTRKALLILAIIPIVTYVQVLFIRRHAFYYRSLELTTMGEFVLFSKVYGPGFYLWVIYAYLIILTGVVILIMGMINMPEKFRFQLIPLIIVILTILGPNIFYMLDFNPAAPYDPTSIMFVISGILLLLTIRHFRLLDIAPVAYNQVFKNVKSGVIILDERAHIQDLNPAAEGILNLSQENALGKPIKQVLPKYQDLLKRLENSPQNRAEFRTGEEHFEVQATPLNDREGASQGRIIMFYDITTRKLAEYELRRQAITDPLTGVLNRRHFYSLAGPIFQQAKRYQRHLTALMIDLDHFKQINDQHGHFIGDQVLTCLANLLVEHIRNSDILARYGGEEFVILMPETSSQSAQTMAKRLRVQVNQSPIETDIGPVPLTISIGMATLETKVDRNIDKLIDRADQALYAAKQTGRNKVVVFKDISQWIIQE